MPFHELAVAPADVAGSALGLALNAPAPAPLAASRLHHPDGSTLLLGVLGASHVITVDRAEIRFSEEISCTARDRGGELPPHADARGYRMHCESGLMGAAEFDALAHRLRERCAADNGWLGGRFPGDDAALTALAARPDGPGWRWRTWHLYPAGSGGTVVATTSRWRP